MCLVKPYLRLKHAFYIYFDHAIKTCSGAVDTKRITTADAGLYAFHVAVLGYVFKNARCSMDQIFYLFLCVSPCFSDRLQLLFANLLCPTHRIEALGTGFQPCNWLGINAGGVGVACSSDKPEAPSGAGLPSCLLASF